MASRFRSRLTALVLAAASASCGPALAGKADDTLRIAYPREVTTLDSLNSNLRENDILSLLVDDALFYIHHDTRAPVPLAAESYKFTTSTTLEIDLRKGIKWHDGTELTAEDVAYTYNWIINPASKSNFHKRIGRWVSGVEVIGPYKVRFNMKVPYSLALYDLAMYSKIRKKGSYHPGGTPNPTAQDLKLIGTGPYQVVEFQPGQRVVLKRFRDYRTGSPKGKPAIENLVIRTIPDWSTQAAEVMSGGINWSFNVPTEIAEDVARSKRGVFMSGPEVRIGYIIMDAVGKAAPNGPLTKQKVRQAINHAIDREGIVKNLVKGSSVAIHAACHPSQFGCPSDVKKYEYNPQKAKQLLAEAGYPTGFDLDFWAARERPEMEAIVNQLNQVGIRTKLRYVKGPSLTKAMRSNEIQAFYGSSGSFSISDAGAIAPDKWSADSDENFSGDAEVAKLIGAANASYDPKERQKNFSRAFHKIAEQAYWAPVYGYTASFLMTPDVDFVPPKDGMPRLFLIKWK